MCQLCGVSSLVSCVQESSVQILKVFSVFFWKFTAVHAELSTARHSEGLS